MSAEVKEPRAVTVLGSTGSIGVQALDVVRASRGRLSIRGLAARADSASMAGQALEFKPSYLAMSDPAAGAAVRRSLKERMGDDAPEVLLGDEGVLELASGMGADVVLNAIVGSAGLLPSLSSLDAGVRLALANKETLVMAGPLVMRKAGRDGALIPVDSEHSSVFRCARGRERSRVRSVTLTASGGAFRGWPPERIARVSPEDALKHPVWDMGRRITVDSASMMNKALEVIEAQHLFDLPPSSVKVVVHPQAYVHGLVELGDGTLLAHLGPPDMRIPIAYALLFPDGDPPGHEALDLAALKTLEFERPDFEKFPCLALGYRAAEEGGTSPAALNAADEMAVEAFLGRRIGFTDIAAVARKVLDAHSTERIESPEQVLEVDRWARELARSLVEA